jgi:DNA-binding IclR family transcriptional regulator
MPLLAGAAGLVLAAAKPDDELRQLLDQVRENRLGRGEELDEERIRALLSGNRR